jgi:hypothetical protein
VLVGRALVSTALASARRLFEGNTCKLNCTQMRAHKMVLPPRPDVAVPSLPPLDVPVDVSAPPPPMITPVPPPSLTEQQMAELCKAFEKVLIKSGSIAPPAPRLSMAVAAKKTALATKIGMAVLGLFTVAGEFIAAHYPHAIGPLSSLFKIGWRMLNPDAPIP